ncbi:MAG: hypothetical protein COB38_10595 [Gammaproteobacteria bacterium]|nr:MAG: hypothetical protein COB38_10595 [Gammaproteobacteria bacterium]
MDIYFQFDASHILIMVSYYFAQFALLKGIIAYDVTNLWPSSEKALAGSWSDFPDSKKLPTEYRKDE